jgi:FkbM family methyltransferase
LALALRIKVLTVVERKILHLLNTIKNMFATKETPKEKRHLVITGIPTCMDRLQHLKEIGFSPKVMFDCGAFIGKWAVKVSEIYSKAELVLIEPNVNLLDEIEKRILPLRERTTIVTSAVSDKVGKGTLNVWDNPKHNNKITALAASSLLTHVQGEPEKKIEVDITTIDNIAKEYRKIPDMLKLDLQGGEFKALLGAKKVLKSVELCIIEFGCLDAYVDRTTPRQVMDIMYDNGFCLYDIVDLRYRPYDGALAGGDFFFIKTSSKLKAHKDYF